MDEFHELTSPKFLPSDFYIRAFFIISLLIVVTLPLVAIAENILRIEGVDFIGEIDPSSSKITIGRMHGEPIIGVLHEFQSQPDRFILDIPNATFNKQNPITVPGNSFIHQIRLGQHGNDVRVVFDLEGPADAKRYASPDQKMLQYALEASSPKYTAVAVKPSAVERTTIEPANTIVSPIDSSANISKVVQREKLSMQPSESLIVVSGTSFNAQIDIQRSALVITRTDGKSSLPPLYMFQRSPDRFVIDVPSAVLNQEKRSFLVQGPLIKGVRTGQHDDAVRIVLDLTAPSTVKKQVSFDNKRYLFTLENQPSVNEAASDQDLNSHQRDATPIGYTLRSNQTMINPRVIDNSLIMVEGTDFTGEVDPRRSMVTITRSSGSQLKDITYQFQRAPDRLVVDIPGAHIIKSDSKEVSANALIERIRTGQHDSGSRIVCDLRAAASLVEQVSRDRAITEYTLTRQNLTDPNISSSSREEVSHEPIASARIEPASAERSFMVKNYTSRSTNLTTSPSTSFPFSVDPVFLSLEPGQRPLKDILVTNRTGNKMILRSVIQRWRDPGTTQERFEGTRALFASPRRLELAPHASRPLRIVLVTGHPETGEDTFRVSLTPENDSSLKVNKGNEVTQPTIDQALHVGVTVPAYQSRGSIKMNEQSDALQLISMGSRAVTMEKCSLCSKKDKSCTSLPKKILFPKRSWVIPRRSSGVLNCELKVGNEVQHVSHTFG